MVFYKVPPKVTIPIPNTEQATFEVPLNRDCRLGSKVQCHGFGVKAGVVAWRLGA